MALLTKSAIAGSLLILSSPAANIVNSGLIVRGDITTTGTVNGAAGVFSKGGSTPTITATGTSTGPAISAIATGAGNAIAATGPLNVSTTGVFGSTLQATTATLLGLILPNATDGWVWTEYSTGHGKWSPTVGDGIGITTTSADTRYVPVARIITAGTGLTGGGSLSANRTIALDIPVAITSGGTNTDGSDFTTYGVMFYRNDGIITNVSDLIWNQGQQRLQFNSGGYNCYTADNPLGDNNAGLFGVANELIATFDGFTYKYANGVINVDPSTGNINLQPTGSVIVTPTSSANAFELNTFIRFDDISGNPTLADEQMVQYRKGTKQVIAYKPTGSAQRYVSIDMAGTLGVAVWTPLTITAP